MTIVELLLIAVGLSMDAFAVAIGKGLSVDKVRPSHAAITGVWFGGFQALMPIVGYMLGHSFQHVVSSIDHWIAFALLLLIGLNMIRETLWADDKESHDSDFGPRKMFVMAVATSIDALAVGVTFAFLKVNIWKSVLLIGITTFIFSFCGVKIGNIFGSRYSKISEIAGGTILIILGVKILIEHLFF